MDELQKALETKNHLSAPMIALGYRLYDQFTLNAAYRRPKELEWLESLRQYKGLYDPDVQIEANNSKVYPKTTRSKINIVLSRLHDMLFPETDKNWEISPTPEPKIDRETVTQIAFSLVKQNPETGEPIIPTASELQLAIKRFAVKTCTAMSSVIDDQLIEMDYPEETKKVLRSGLKYGTGIMKGPMVNKRSKRRWAANEGGEYEETLINEDIPFMEAVRIWDWYPDMSVVDLDKMSGSFQNHIMSKHDLRQLMKRPDFYPDVITKYLESHPDGDYVPQSWEVDLQTVEMEAGSGRMGVAITSTSGDSDRLNRGTNRQLGKRYQTLEFWGYVDGSDLAACGLDIPDVTLEYGVNIWLLGKMMIKIALFEGALDHYKVFYYEKDETSIFGEGLARIMRHSALSIAAAARMVLDNGAICSGPQFEVNWSLTTPGTDIDSVFPRKIWYREGRGIESQYPAIRILNADSHIPELLQIISTFKQFGDEETTLPTWLIGQPTNNETAQSVSSRSASITVSIKDIAKNFDTFTEKVLRDLYMWNMEFNPREDIKGDYNVKARGVSSLVMKEIRSQALTQLKSTLTPEDWVYVPRQEFVAEIFKAHDINIALRTEEEAQKIIEAQEQSIQMQLALKMQEAEIGYKRAQSMAQLAKAKDKNVDAELKMITPPDQGEFPPDPRLEKLDVIGKEADVMSKSQGIQHADEKHQLEMAQADDKHRAEMATKMMQTASDVSTKTAQAQHGMKMKEKEMENRTKEMEGKTKMMKQTAKSSGMPVTKKKTPKGKGGSKA